MAKIKMDPTEMTSKALQLDKQGDELKRVVTKMTTLVTQLCGAWEGSASTAFMTQYNGLKPGFTKTEKLVHDLAKQVRDISKIMADADSDIAKKLNA